MRLTAKFLLAFIATSLIVLAVNAVVRVQREVAHFDDDIRQDAGAFVSSLAHAVEAVATGLGREEAIRVVQRASAQAPHLKVRWVSLDRVDGELGAPIAPATELEPLSRGALVFSMTPSASGIPGALLAYAPVAGDVAGEGSTAIEATESLEARDRFVRGSVERTAITLTIAFATSALVALVLGMVLIGRPLAAIVGKVRRIAGGDLTTPLELRQRDEIGEVASELNAMCDRLARKRVALEAETTARVAALEQLRHAERLATVGRLAAGLAHEIGTPLAVVAGRSKMIVTGEAIGDEVIQNAQIVCEQTQRIAAIIRQLLDFARRSPAQRGRVEAVELARRAVDLLHPIAGKQRVSLVVADPEHETIYAEVDRGQIEQALTNLLVNALQATGPGGEVRVAVGRARTRSPPECGGTEGDFISLAVSDTGSGMDEQTVAHVFEPFFTTKGPGEGTGLGLPVAHGLVHEHGGWIAVESELGRGSRFTVYVPAAKDDVE